MPGYNLLSVGTPSFRDTLKAHCDLGNSTDSGEPRESTLKERERENEREDGEVRISKIRPFAKGNELETYTEDVAK